MSDLWSSLLGQTDLSIRVVRPRRTLDDPGWRDEVGAWIDEIVPPIIRSDYEAQQTRALELVTSLRGLMPSQPRIPFPPPATSHADHFGSFANLYEATSDGDETVEEWSDWYREMATDTAIVNSGRVLPANPGAIQRNHGKFIANCSDVEQWVGSATDRRFLPIDPEAAAVAGDAIAVLEYLHDLNRYLIRGRREAQGRFVGLALLALRRHVHNAAAEGWLPMAA